MNLPKDPNDAYFFLGVGLSAIGFGISTHYPFPDYTVNAGFWIPQVFGIGSLIRWIGGGVWSDVDRARMALGVQLNLDAAQAKRDMEALGTVKPTDGFTPVNRSMIPQLVTNQQAVEMPRLNMQRHFFESVLRMYDLDPVKQSRVDMTETRWVVERKLFTQKPFQKMKRRAADAGALKKVNKKFFVNDRGVLAWLAAGNELPE